MLGCDMEGKVGMPGKSRLDVYTWLIDTTHWTIQWELYKRNS